MTQNASPRHIVLAGGCFWCVEAVFNQVRGVRLAESGYSNGDGSVPTYEAVCGGQTGYAEVVKVVYDPAQITLPDILAIFFAIHDPTTLNRQGADRGTQYRSAVYWSDADDEAVVRAAVAQAQNDWAQPVVTELAPLQSYHPAEAYHQRYFERHPNQGYCAAVIAPKLVKFRAKFGERFGADSRG